MGQGPGVVKISKKTRGRKSRVSVPLRIKSNAKNATEEN